MVVASVPLDEYEVESWQIASHMKDSYTNHSYVKYYLRDTS